MWVLVTDFDPLTVWLYDDYRVNAAIKEYTSENTDPLAHVISDKIARKWLLSDEGIATMEQDKSFKLSLLPSEF